MTTLTRIALCLMLAALAGCSYEPYPESRTRNAAPEAIDPLVYRDRQTGCEYLTRGNSSSSLTPRIAADGKTHMGCNGATP
jgi:hypothetical protein